MLRRNFLAQLAGGTAAVALRGAQSAFAVKHIKQKAPKPAPSVNSKLQRISISTWSLHNYFRTTRHSDFTLPGAMLALLDFPEMIVERYKVHHFEFCSTHFPSTELAYLRELKYMLTHTGSTIVNMPVDIPECGSEGTFSDPDPVTRQSALDAVKLWVDVAHTLGVRSVRVGPGKIDPENLAPTTESYKALAAYAQSKNVHVIVENHAGFGTERPEELVALLKLAGPGRLGALPDFANFPDESTREKGLKLLFPYAPTVCHAKGLEFSADGAETGYDFPLAVDIAKRAAFHGIYSIEFDGPGDPYAGIQKTLDELLKYL